MFVVNSYLKILSSLLYLDVKSVDLKLLWLLWKMRQISFLLPLNKLSLSNQSYLKFKKRGYLAAAWLAQLGERRSAEREVAGSDPGRTNN